MYQYLIKFKGRVVCDDSIREIVTQLESKEILNIHQIVERLQEEFNTVSEVTFKEYIYSETYGDFVDVDRDIERKWGAYP